MNEELIAKLVAALEQADLLINSYCVCKPSRIKAETRATVEEALGAAKKMSSPTRTINGARRASHMLASPSQTESSRLCCGGASIDYNTRNVDEVTCRACLAVMAVYDSTARR